MALPAGCRTVCRPARRFPRKYTAEDVGRIACYAREAGESNEAILQAISRCVQVDTGCDEARATAHRLAVAVEVAAASIIALAGVALLRQKSSVLVSEQMTALQRIAERYKNVPVTFTNEVRRLNSVLIEQAARDAEFNQHLTDLNNELMLALNPETEPGLTIEEP